LNLFRHNKLLVATALIFWCSLVCGQVATPPAPAQPAREACRYSLTSTNAYAAPGTPRALIRVSWLPDSPADRLAGPVANASSAITALMKLLPLGLPQPVQRS